MARSLKRGAVLTEFALMTPIMMVFFLLIVQYAQIVKTNWVVDFAAENACRAEIVRKEFHPDATVAAQLSLIPVSSTSFIKHVPSLEADNRYLSWGTHYLGAIAKTKVDVQEVGNRYIVFCTVTHAMELKIPIANKILGHSTKVIELAKNYLKQYNEQESELNLAEYWSAMSGRPHILLKREVMIRY